MIDFSFEPPYIHKYICVQYYTFFIVLTYHHLGNFNINTYFTVVIEPISYTKNNNIKITGLK